MIRGRLSRLIKPKKAARRLSYAEAKAQATSGNTEARRAVAVDPETKPELLYFLARDVSPAVRSAIAANPSTPRQADLLLALDESTEIRTMVAEKVTRQVHSIAQDDAAQLWQLTVSVLEALARDDLTRVRQLVAETASGLAKLPKPIAYTLAKDHDASVAVPALAYPGRFLDEELVAVVEGTHDSRIIGAVARRPAIGGKVSEAVVASGDDAAIAILLDNRSAEILPQTFDRVVERAPANSAWHEALAGRPDLPEPAALRVSGFVASALVGVLETRRRAPAAERATAVPAADRLVAEPVVPEVLVPNEDPVARARRLNAENRLSEDTVIDGLTDQDFTIACLALRSRLPPAIVSKILSSHSAKGLTSLAWRAGYSMRLALQLQIRIGHLPPKARLNASGGTWPLTQSEMEWQIDFFKSLVAG